MVYIKKKKTFKKKKNAHEVKVREVWHAAVHGVAGSDWVTEQQQQGNKTGFLR